MAGHKTILSRSLFAAPRARMRQNLRVKVTDTFRSALPSVGRKGECKDFRPSVRPCCAGEGV